MKESVKKIEKVTWAFSLEDSIWKEIKYITVDKNITISDVFDEFALILKGKLKKE